MTPRHLVTIYPRTASPPPPAERRGVITLETSVTRRPVAGCHVSRVTWREHCHHTVTGDQVPGVTTDGESRGESHSHITVTRHTGHTAAAGHTLSRSVTLVVPLTCWLHAAARSCGVAGRGKTEQLRARRRLLQCTHQPHIGPWRGAAAGASAACAGLKQSLHNI